MKADSVTAPRILVLASGSGTNLQALINASRERDFPGQIVADAAILEVEHRLIPEPRLVVQCELLLLEES